MSVKDLEEQYSVEEDRDTNERILNLVGFSGIWYYRMTHAPVRTSAQAAEIRGVSLESGSKAILCEAKSENTIKYYVCVMSAVKQIDWKKLRKLIGKSAQMINNDNEVKRITGCVPGAVPPFGSVFKGEHVQTLLDQSLIDQGELMNFNVGLRTESLRLYVKDYLKLEKPIIEHFTKD